MIRLVAGRTYFGEPLNPFGDFDFYLGRPLEIEDLEVPIRYRRRVAGESKVRFFKHGQLLIRMAFIALYRFKISAADGKVNRPRKCLRIKSSISLLQV